MADQHRRHVRNSQDVKIGEEAEINDQLLQNLLAQPRLSRNLRSLRRRLRKHRHRPTVAGNVLMRSWELSKVVCVAPDRNVVRSKS